MLRLSRRVFAPIAMPIAILLLGSLPLGCERPEPTAPAAPELEPQPILGSVDLGSVDLSSILARIELPDLSEPRHTEALISAAEGGVIELGGVRLEVPPGALAQSTTITLALPTDPLLARYLVADFGPDGLEFQKPVTIRFDLTGVNLEGVDLGTLRVSWWDGSSWVGVESEVSAGGDALLGYTTHFTGWGAETPSGG